MHFPVKRNICFTIVIWGFLIFVILAYIFGGEAVGNQLITYNSPTGYLLTILMVAISLWFWFGTSYKIEGGKLNIKFGPYRKRIKINDIKKITREDHLLSKGTLCIHYGEYDVIHLSPKDKNKFLNVLLASNSAIQLEPRDEIHKSNQTRD